MAKRTRSCWPNLPMGGSTCLAFSLAPWKRTTIRRWYFLRSNIHLCRWMWTGAWAGLRQSWRSTVSTCHVDLSTSFSPRWTRASYIYEHIIFRRTPIFWNKTKITSQIMWRTTRPTWTSWRSQLTLLRPTCAPGHILSFLRFFFCSCTSHHFGYYHRHQVASLETRIKYDDGLRSVTGSDTQVMPEGLWTFQHVVESVFFERTKQK